MDWSEEAIRNGSITVEEIPELDFSFVLTPNSKHWISGRPEVEGARWTHSVCHQFAVHNATNSSRILVSDGRRHDFYYRYETWVETVTRKPKPRLALRSVAERFNGWEGKKIWTGDDISDIVPHLSMAPKAQSKLDAQAVKEALIEFFSTSNG